ncbi:hypothetical protein [Micromonospora echinaurantiaca]|uniref:hypothetical protein n=1 Tax=Micromonospora echinaurantiaca TaxID=47857 RepID=UPI00343E974F
MASPETSASQSERNTNWLQITIAVASFVISIAALGISAATMKDQAAANMFSRDAAARTLASRVTFWQITGEPAEKLFPSSENVVEIQNRSISGIDWILVEREIDGQDNRWYVLPELPPCSSLSFPAPYEEGSKEHWEIESMYFYNENGWWWRGDAGTLRPKVVRQDEPKLEYDSGLTEQMEEGIWPYSIRELEACS